MTEADEVQQLIDDGMRRQLETFHAALAAGMPRIGWKVGASTAAAQQRLGVPAAIVGWLDGRRMFEPGAPYRPTPGAKPRIEAETAIRIGSSLAPGASIAEARAAIAAAAPAIEFVDATKPLAPATELLAHNIIHDGTLFGAEKDLSAASGLLARGLPQVSLNGQPHRAGNPGSYPEDLAEIALHVANVLGHYGEELLAGDRIICGSYIDPFDVAPGDTVTADFGDFGQLSFKVE